ncbi:MAG: universal stress protein [Anaerolineales bacterium]|nr:universal stress protein [Anaerolineales bacterium]
MNILICTDKSRNALAAVSMGGRLAAAFEARESTTLLAAGKNKDRTYQALEESQNTLLEFGIQARTLVRFGPAVQEFINEIQSTCYDLVVIGYRKRSALEKAFNGCVATRVVHQASASVLVVREGRADICKILIGIGGNGFTEQISRWGANIAAAVGAQVTLIHVETAPPLMYAGLAEVHQTLEELLETDTAAANAIRNAAAILDNAGVEASIKLAHGVADRELLRTAQEGDYDLIILGSSWARSPIDRVVLSNVNRDVLHNTRRPVLVVHP